MAWHQHMVFIYKSPGRIEILRKFYGKVFAFNYCITHCNSLMQCEVQKKKLKRQTTFNTQTKFLSFKSRCWHGMVQHAFNLSTWDAKVCGSLWVWVQPRLPSEILSQNNNKVSMIFSPMDEISLSTDFYAPIYKTIFSQSPTLYTFLITQLVHFCARP